MLLSDELEGTIKRAYERARTSRHEFVSAEHLLFALTYDTVGREVLSGCGVEIEKLRAELDTFLDETMPSFPEDVGAETGEVPDPPDPQPTIGMQAVLQLAAMHVQSAGKEHMDAGNVLAAMFRARESHAVAGNHAVARIDCPHRDFRPVGCRVVE